MRKILVIFLGALCLTVQPFKAQAELLERVIAVVNDEPIMQSELDIMLRPIYEQFRAEYRGEQLVMRLNDARQKLLNQLIEDKLVLQKAEEMGIEADPAAIEARIDEFKKQFESELQMEDTMAMQGVTLGEVRERFEKQAMLRQLHNREVRSYVAISPKEIEEFYKTNPEYFASASKIKVRSITIKKSFESRDKGITDEVAKEKLATLQRRILSGESFSDLAKQYSEDSHKDEGGLSDWIEEGTMIPAINNVIFRLELGEISDPIETPMGYHLFRVEQREPGYKKTLEEAREDIHNRIFQQKSEERFYDWMQELKRNAYISIR